MGKRTGNPRGRPPKPKSPPPDSPKRYGLRQTIDDAITPAGKQQAIKALFKRSPGEAARVMASIEPKEKPAEEGKSFFLLIHGLSDGVSCLRCGWQRGVPYCADLPWLQALSDEQKAAYQEESNKLARARPLKGRTAEKESGSQEPSTWRDAARAEGVTVPSAGPNTKERSPGDDAAPFDPPPTPLRSPDGSLINLSAPTRPAFGNGGIP